EIRRRELRFPHLRVYSPKQQLELVLLQKRRRLAYREEYVGLVLLRALSSASAMRMRSSSIVCSFTALLPAACSA
ncbi:MAG: hypothetical protein V8S87_04610, partial [Oscillospiraceae bacterium]